MSNEQSAPVYCGGIFRSVFGNGNGNFRRFHRWVQEGLFDGMFSILFDVFDLSIVSVDGTIMQVHAEAFGSEKGATTKASDT